MSINNSSEEAWTTLELLASKLQQNVLRLFMFTFLVHGVQVG
jgi:hypothetical protein